MIAEGLDCIISMHSRMSVPSVFELAVSGHTICNSKDLTLFGGETAV